MGLKQLRVAAITTESILERTVTKEAKGMPVSISMANMPGFDLSGNDKDSRFVAAPSAASTQKECINFESDNNNKFECRVPEINY